MAKMARVIVSEFPHHVIQRGNRRQQVFFNENDYEEYLILLNIYTHRFKVNILVYCLMPNHVHLITTPSEDKSLAQGVGETHRNYFNYRTNRAAIEG